MVASITAYLLGMFAKYRVAQPSYVIPRKESVPSAGRLALPSQLPFATLPPSTTASVYVPAALGISTAHDSLRQSHARVPEGHIKLCDACVTQQPPNSEPPDRPSDKSKASIDLGVKKKPVLPD